jgi:hypothetical protein
VQIISCCAVVCVRRWLTCESKAVGKGSKPLAGAVWTSFIRKCQRDACAAKAVGSNGKKLYGAAKSSFMKKCEAGAVAEANGS